MVRRDYDGLRRYAHIGTGNYHEDTARIYSDVGLLTSDPQIGADLTELFNYLTTGFKPKRRYTKILPAPTFLKPSLLEKIDREIALHTTETPGLIQMKMNALEDVDITRSLYRAAQAGIQIDLLVRDTCRLRPGIPGLSDSVRVVSVLGRFLEHARIVHFGNGGKDEYYIGSADCMARNLQSRVEVLTPIDEPALQAELQTILDVQLADRRCAWEMKSDGSYVQHRPDKGQTSRGSQEELTDLASRAHKEASRLRKRKTQGIARRKAR